MESVRWYVKLGEESIGPLTNDEFMELARTGSVGPQTAVSPDQLTWIQARTVQGLIFAPTQPPMLPIQASRRTVAKRNARWTLVVLGAVVVVVILIVLVANTGALTQESQNVNRTYQYWNQVSAVFKSASGTPPGVSTFRFVAASVEKLPTVGVDPEAINCALSVTGVLKECADLMESENDPSENAGQFLRGFYGGWSGDFQPLLHELESKNDRHKALASHAKTAQQQMIQTRAMLSSRYGVEFPPL
jgi:GYF domain 2